LFFLRRLDAGTMREDNFEYPNSVKGRNSFPMLTQFSLPNQVNFSSTATLRLTSNNAPTGMKSASRPNFRFKSTRVPACFIKVRRNSLTLSSVS